MFSRIIHTSVLLALWWGVLVYPTLLLVSVQIELVVLVEAYAEAVVVEGEGEGVTMNTEGRRP